MTIRIETDLVEPSFEKVLGLLIGQESGAIEEVYDRYRQTILGQRDGNVITFSPTLNHSDIVTTIHKLIELAQQHQDYTLRFTFNKVTLQVNSYSIFDRILGRYEGHLEERKLHSNKRTTLILPVT